MARRLGVPVLLLASISIGLLAGELLARAALDEVDFLEPRLAPHPVLGHQILPHSGRHDAWGFRNPEVPEAAEIVAIGDSLTYGFSAPGAESWPAWLARLTGRRVYNMALGGYAPADYGYLFDSRAVSLAPRVVVFGFYLGNDLPGAYRHAAGIERTVADMTGESARRRLGGLRRWLAERSLLYQVVKRQAVELTAPLRSAEALALGHAPEARLEHPALGTAFRLEERLAAVDLERPEIRLGLDASLQIFAEVEGRCRKAGIRCLYLLLPSKESVYLPLAQARMAPPALATLQRLVAQEDLIRQAASLAMAGQGLDWVDPLPALRHAVVRQRVYRPDSDEHPIGAGYRVIAEVVAERLRQPRPVSEPNPLPRPPAPGTGLPAGAS